MPIASEHQREREREREREVERERDGWLVGIREDRKDGLQKKIMRGREGEREGGRRMDKGGIGLR